MSFNINLISNIWNPVAPSVSGGLEVFNYYLANELEKEGKKVKLYASGDSKKSDFLKPLLDESLASRGIKYLSEPWNYRRMSVEEFAIFTDLVQNKLKPDEIVHFSLVNFLPIYLAVKKGLKIVTTLHMPVTNFHYQTLKKLLTPEEIKRIHLVGISKSQVKNFDGICEIIPNGVNTDDFSFSEKYRDNFVWLGRIIPEKGAKDAIVASQKAKVRLELAGAPKSKNEEDYFLQEIKPHLGKNIVHKGFVGGKERNKFYQGKAFIFTPKWDEAFGLTMIEALSCGTPVIAYDRGAVREVIGDGKTGFIVPADNIKALSEAMGKINSLSEEKYLSMRYDCRKAVEEKFSLKAMTEKYIELYKKVSNES